MSKIKNKDEFKERDEIEEYFSDVKKKGFPISILFIILFLLIIGGLSYYYFVIDSPKNIFLTLINEKYNNLKNNYESHKQVNYEFSLDTNIETTNKEYIDIINIINQIAITGTGGLDLNLKKNYTKLNTFYNGEDLLELDTYYNNNQSIYLKSESLYNKVIKVNLNNQANKENNNNKDYNLDIDNFEKLLNSLSDTLRPLLNNASYEKEYTNINNTFVKKITLIIDKEFLKELYNNLLDNNDFLESYSKLQGITKKDLEESLNKAINNLDNNIYKISLYVSILENKFISLEIISEEDRVTITKEEDKYNYKLYDNSIIEYQGYIQIIKKNNQYDISLSIEDIKKELNIKLNTDISFEYNKTLEYPDIDNAIDYNSLTEKDINKIENNINNNKNFIKLIEDIKTLFKSSKD